MTRSENFLHKEAHTHNCLEIYSLSHLSCFSFVPILVGSCLTWYCNWLFLYFRFSIFILSFFFLHYKVAI